MLCDCDTSGTSTAVDDIRTWPKFTVLFVEPLFGSRATSCADVDSIDSPGDNFVLILREPLRAALTKRSTQEHGMGNPERNTVIKLQSQPVVDA
jgi:hypothetical protein